MRIVIDLQGAQGASRLRGIGRYALSIAKAIVRNRGKHEIFIALNGLFPDSIESIRTEFNGLLKQENILVWSSPGPVCSLSSDNDWRRKTAELVREAFLASLKPDFLLITSLFESFWDDTVTSIGEFSRNIPTATVLYDLIPFIYRHSYLKNPMFEATYENKLNYLRRADLLLAISESSRQEGIRYLGFSEEDVITISAAVDSQFRPLSISGKQEVEIRKRYNLHCSYIMCVVGGIAWRQNIEGLIRAYARLPKTLRLRHQLAVVCSIQPHQKIQFKKLAAKEGLLEDELILTGFVPENDLLALYNLCKLFVFPSFHEGFGLPVLEAMSCGRAVIGSNASSIPEIIFRKDAMFNPKNNEEITKKIYELFTNNTFRFELERHGLKRAKAFSWDKCALRAISAFENFNKKYKKPQQGVSCNFKKKLKLAYISPLPPEKSGISYYSAELLPELSHHYDIEVIVNQNSVISDIKEMFQVRDIKWFQEHIHDYDRVLYHFGNSRFHSHMFKLLEQVSGVVVLHDFFLSSIVAQMDTSGFSPNKLISTLYREHGYHAVKERFQAKNLSDVIWKYPCNIDILQNAYGIIVHSEYSRRLAKKYYGKAVTDNWAVIPHLRASVYNYNRIEARHALNLSTEDFIICSFGLLDPTKLNHLLDAWLGSSMASNKHCKLIFVGENAGGDYGKKLLNKIKQRGLGERVIITGWIDDTSFHNYLATADIAVQIRTLSRGETSGTVLDCMNYGLPIIVNAHGNLADLPNGVVWKLPDQFSDLELIEAMETLWKSESLRKQLGKQAREKILSSHKPRVCADQYVNAIEGCYQKPNTYIPSLIEKIAKIKPMKNESKNLLPLSKAIDQSIPPSPRFRQLFVDVSELIQRDARSGIQRVVRSILLKWLTHPPEGIRVEPVYATTTRGYYYARRFALNFLNCPSKTLIDGPIEYHNGDIFFGLDFHTSVVRAQQHFYQQLRRYGVQVQFVVYDLLPYLIPEYFTKNLENAFNRWLDIVVQSDGAICISKSVANDLMKWVKENCPKRLQTFKIKWFHLGGDIESLIPSRGLPNDAGAVLKTIQEQNSFLMVGTIEPRKGHAQTLSAFEELWANGIEVNLVIVGKRGWAMDTWINKLQLHPKYGKRLFWLKSISDEYMEKVYDASACMIAASEGEGFGLPLIEAAKHKLPIIVRDIPVFREVAGKHAFYFSGTDAKSLAFAIKEWLMLFQLKRHPASGDMSWLTWAESAKQLFEAIKEIKTQKLSQQLSMKEKTKVESIYNLNFSGKTNHCSNLM